MPTILKLPAPLGVASRVAETSNGPQHPLVGVPTCVKVKSKKVSALAGAVPKRPPTTHAVAKAMHAADLFNTRMMSPQAKDLAIVCTVARDYELNASSLHRHRTNCLKLASSNAIKKEAARGSAAVALLPSKETLSDAYFELRTRIDQIVAQAEQKGSLAVAVSGLNSIRQTLDSLARLA